MGNDIVHEHAITQISQLLEDRSVNPILHYKWIEYIKMVNIPYCILAQKNTGGDKLNLYCVAKRIYMLQRASHIRNHPPYKASDKDF